MNAQGLVPVWKGKIGGIFEYTPENEPNKRFQKFVRPPGTRTLIISPENKILLTKDFRQEIKGFDYRLPGGKVFNSLDEYLAALGKNEDMLEAAKRGCLAEIKEESGIEGRDPKLFHLSTSGGPTVDWDLYYFVVTDYKDTGKQSLEPGENISVAWYALGEVVEMCLTNKIQEDRTSSTILKYLHSKEKLSLKTN